MENQATRWVDAHLAALFGRDWVTLDDLYTDEVVLEDHRRFVAIERFVGRTEMLAGSKSIVDIGARGADPTVLELRDDDRCLVSIRYHGAGAELTVLDVIEVAADGRLVRSDVYEVDDLVSARARLRS